MERDQSNSPALIALETCGERVTGNDWRLHIDHEVATDLRKYRSYRGESVRDLLRALRNKVSEKHKTALTDRQARHKCCVLLFFKFLYSQLMLKW